MTGKQSGRWDSPLSADMFTVDATKLKELVVDCTGSNENIYLLEQRASEGGKTCLVGLEGTAIPEQVKAMDVATRVHEYGGGPFGVRGNLLVAYDQTQSTLVYCQLSGNDTPKPVFPVDHPFHGHRFADFNIHPSLQLFTCIVEIHVGYTVSNQVCVVELEISTATIIASSHDFYACPRFSPDGTKILYIAWNHPHMPWSSTELYAGSWVDGRVEGLKVVASGASNTRPVWGSDKKIYYSSDVNGFNNVFVHDTSTGVSEVLVKMDAEFSSPDWVFNM